MPRNDFINVDGTINYDNITSKPDFTAHQANNVRHNFSILDYGAIGDNATINTTAIQQALNAAAGVGTLVVPYGIFLTNNLIIPSNTHLVILGTLKMPVNGNNQLLKIENVNNVTIDGYGIGILDGNGVNQITSADLACIYNGPGAGATTQNVLIKDLIITKAKSWPVNFAGLNCRFEGCTVSNSPNMSFFGPGSVNCSWINCLCFGITNDFGIGFYGGVKNCIMSGCIVYGLTTPGLSGIAVANDTSQPTANDGVVISDCISYNNTGCGFSVWGVNNYETNVSFINCIAHHNNLENGSPLGGAGFDIIKAKNVNIIGCQSHHNGNGPQGASGIYYNDCFNVNIKDNIISNEGQGSTNGYGILGSGTDVLIDGNTIFDNQTTKTMSVYVQTTGGSNVDLINNNLLPGVVTTYGTAFRKIVNNSGINPVGKITSPAMVSNGQTYVNSSPYTYDVYIFGGTVTAIDIDVSGTGLITGCFRINPGSQITLWYTAQPSWNWVGH